MAQTAKVQVPKARAMTNGEMRTLLDAGLDPAQWDKDKPNYMTKLFTNWVCDNLYKDFDFKDTPQPDCTKLALDTYKLTNGSDEDEKNS